MRKRKNKINGFTLRIFKAFSIILNVEFHLVFTSISSSRQGTFSQIAACSKRVLRRDERRIATIHVRSCIGEHGLIILKYKSKQ